MTLGEHQQAFSRDLVKLMSKAFDALCTHYNPSFGVTETLIQS